MTASRVQWLPTVTSMSASMAPPTSPPGGKSQVSSGAVTPARRSVERLGQLGHTEPRGAAGQRGARRWHQAVAVGVALDDRHHLRRPRPARQLGDVVADGVEVDADPRRGARGRGGRGGGGRGGHGPDESRTPRSAARPSRWATAAGMPWATASARTGPTGVGAVGGDAVDEGAQGTGDVGGQAGGEQRAEQPGEHVARPGGGQPRRGVGLRPGGGALAGRHDEGGGALEQHGRAGELGQGAGVGSGPGLDLLPAHLRSARPGGSGGGRTRPRAA